MGGAACQVIIHALVRYEEVPTSHKERAELESQLRQCYANPTIAAELEKDEANAERLWNILEKPHLTPVDLSDLLKGLPQYSE